MALFDTFFSKSEKNRQKMAIFGHFLPIFCIFCKKRQKKAKKWLFLTIFDEKMTFFKIFLSKNDKKMQKMTKC